MKFGAILQCHGDISSCTHLHVEPSGGVHTPHEKHGDLSPRLRSLLLMIFTLIQANSNAREGRVMIYNLVEAAQEFLSEIVPVGPSHESVSVATCCSVIISILVNMLVYYQLICRGIYTS